MGKRSAAAVVESPPDNKKNKQSKSVTDESIDEANQSTVSSSLNELTFSEKLAFASPIASPIAGKKLTKKLLKLIRKSCKHKNHFRSGLRDVQTRIRKGETGICIFASDVTPIDVMAHLPAVCEEKEIPFVFVPMRSDISQAMGVRRPTMMALIVDVKDKTAASFADYADLYQECIDGIKELN